MEGKRGIFPLGLSQPPTRNYGRLMCQVGKVTTVCLSVDIVAAVRLVLVTTVVELLLKWRTRTANGQREMYRYVKKVEE